MEKHKLKRWNYLITRLFTGDEKNEARDVKMDLRKIRANEFKDQLIDSLKTSDVNNVNEVGRIIAIHCKNLPNEIRGWFVKGITDTLQK